MVYIHGGGFREGSGNEDSYGPQYFLKQNVILVTLNYRLGLYGFSSLETKEYPGNNGLKDQRLAIQWVYENIRNFQGDPENISLFGHSAGGMSVHLHLLSPTPNLFKSAISLSGTLGAPVGLNKHLRNQTLMAAEKLNCSVSSSSPNDDETIIKCLERIPARHIATLRSVYPLIPSFLPTSEPEDATNLFFTGDPIQLMKSGHFKKIPFITGITSGEFLLFNSDEYIQATTENFQLIWTKFFYHFVNMYNKKSSDELKKEIIKFYFENQEKVHLDKATNLISFHSDLQFITGPWHSTLLMSKMNPNNNYYFYAFSFEGLLETNKHRILKGVKHGEDLNYLFYRNNIPTYLTRSDSNEKKIVELFTSLLVNFAKTGNPSSSWDPVKNQKITYLNIGEISTTTTTTLKQMENETYPIGKRIQFWERFF